MSDPRGGSAFQDWGTVFGGIADGWLFSDLDGSLPATVVLPLENPDLYDPVVWEKKAEVVSRHRSVTVLRHRGATFGVLTAKLGAPAAAMAVQAAAARGVRSLFGVGYCGAIADAIGCGDLVVPTGAVSADGTSRAYCPERYPAVADHSLVSLLKQVTGGQVHDGLVHSLDAVLTQDSALVDRCRATHVDALDMETSAVLTVARLHGVRAATVLVASDHAGAGRHTDGDLLDAGTRRAVDVVLEAVSLHAAPPE
ncbi:phosphorylase family protein [Streptomyces sp. NPDC001665]